MTRRKLLSPAQHANLLTLPKPEDQRLMARYYTFSAHDLAVINRRETAANRLGYAVQLGYLRYPGRKWRFREAVPEHLLEYVAEQLAVPADAIKVYNQGRQARHSEFLSSIQREFGYQGFTEAVAQDIRAWLLPVAQSLDRGFTLITTLIDELRRRRVILPALSTLEHLVAEVREQARQMVYETLTAQLTTEQEKLIDLLLVVRMDTDRTYKTWLLEPVGQACPANFWKRLDRLNFVRRIKLSPELRQTINPDRLRQLAREGERLNAWRMKRGDDPLRYRAMLIAFLLEMEERLTDQTLTMHDRIISQMLNRADKKHAKSFHEDGAAINETVRLFKQVGEALIKARARGADAYAAIESVVPWEHFVAYIEQAETLERPQDFDALDLLSGWYSTVRQYSPALLEHFEFQGGPNTRGLRHALRLLRDLDANDRSQVPRWAPVDFVPKRWQAYVITDEGINRTYYELCALVELRNRLRAGDLWVTGSRQYRALETFLLSQTRWETIKQDEVIPVEIDTDFQTYIVERSRCLHETLERVNALVASDGLPDVSLSDGKLRFTRLKTPTPDNMDTFTRRVYGLVPHIKITDLLLEVDASTGISRLFTDIRTGAFAEDRVALFTAILADAVNLGLLKMAEASSQSYYRLAWLFDWYIRDDTYQQALAELVNIHHKQPLAAYWGDGTTAAADGQFFPVGGTKTPTARVSRHYGGEPGLLIYTHVSDQGEPFFTRVISTSEHQAPYALDGLLYHESDLEIEELHTDTGGYSDHIFAMFHLLGFRFAPRLRNFNTYRLYTIGKTTTYPALSNWIGGRVNTKLIEQYWDEILRLASSIRLGTVTASLILKRLGSYARQNQLAKALPEFGRIEKTLFMLNWLQDAMLRRRVIGSLSRREHYNSLAQAVFFHRQGKVRDRTYENQSNRASGLTLVIAAIALWNTVYLTRAIEVLREQGEEVTDEHLRHLSPLHWGHINLTGDYTWNVNLSTDLERLRPLPT